jgi:CBS domain-containing protein
MFFVFGPSGQTFRGGPDQLAQVAPVRRVQRHQALRTRSDDPQAVEPAVEAATAPPSPPKSHRLLDAVSAYVQTELGPAPARHPLTRVRDVMSADALAVPPETRVNDAWQTLAEHHVSQAPVVNAQGQVVGLLLRADMAPLDLLPEPGAVQQAIALARRPVAEVMVSPIPTVSADTELRRVAGVLLETGLPGLPVTDETGRLAGFLSRTDILRAVAFDPPLDLWSGPRPQEGI